MAALEMENEANVDGAPEAHSPDGGAEQVLDDVLVEDISIDGMCGVY
jgi:mycofactocin precursor